MVRLGYVTGNRMSNLQARNAKLRERAVRILMAEANIDQNDASAVLAAANGDLRVALVMKRSGCSRSAAEQSLAASHGVVSVAVETLTSE